MRVNEQLELDDSPFLNEKYHKDCQDIIVEFQQLVVAYIFDLASDVSSFSKCAAAPQVGRIDLASGNVCELKKYPKRGYVINPQKRTIDTDYEKFQMKYYFGNKYA